MIRLVIASLILGTLLACDDSDGTDTDYTESRRKLATTYKGYASDGYGELSESTQALVAAVSSFTDQPDSESLAVARATLNSVRKDWQRIAPFQFGPADDVILRSGLNTYPADQDQIELNIVTQDYTLGSPTNLGAEGFPAIEYLLYGDEKSFDEIVHQYINDDSNRRQAYLLALCTQVSTLVTSVNTAWNSDYGQQFDADGAHGTDVGSSLSLIVNAYEFHLQRFLRDGKVGIPAGVRSAGVPRPTATEAYYSGTSAVLIVSALSDMKDIFSGDFDPNGFAMYDYLVELNFGNLGDEILLQFDETIAKAEALTDPLSEQIQSDNEKVLDLFVEMQQLIPMIKSDMASAMGVIITNQDADGD